MEDFGDEEVTVLVPVFAYYDEIFMPPVDVCDFDDGPTVIDEQNE